jgi:hypothetical protein
MPTYQVTDPTTGKQVKLTGDSPPTEQELSQIFSGLGNTGASPAPMSFLDRIKAGINASGAESDLAMAPAENLNMDNFGKPLADNVMKMLPVIGATGGAVLGSPNPLTAVMGAGTGGAAGKSLEDVLRRLTGIGEQPQVPGAGPLKTGAEMATWEAGSGPLISLLTKIGGPFAKMFENNPAAQNISKFATENNLPMSPSTILPTNTAKAVGGPLIYSPREKQLPRNIRMTSIDGFWIQDRNSLKK